MDINIIDEFDNLCSRNLQKDRLIPDLEPLFQYSNSVQFATAINIRS